MHGKGEYIIEGKYTYFGELKNDDIEGLGICSWLNGKKYEGTWLSNKMHGEGVFTWMDGK